MSIAKVLLDARHEIERIISENSGRYACQRERVDPVLKAMHELQEQLDRNSQDENLKKNGIRL